MSIEIQPYFAEGERYPALIGVRAEGDEYETAYVSKSELVDALADNAKLRELVADMWREGMCECGSRGKCASCEYDYPTRMRDLGVEVDA